MSQSFYMSDALAAIAVSLAQLPQKGTTLVFSAVVVDEDGKAHSKINIKKQSDAQMLEAMEFMQASLDKAKQDLELANSNSAPAISYQ
ncbi:hypothetical protein [Halodesulfovibrio aestuarii]|uniref:Uncharacterized protein n=1 Tax=Halodesulfovibrio aestuarii TaxID=126333 RepID=A0A8G2C7Z0_9BACT|nr:hypothetical protein [Halodesulfovibrio aestuarii]SHI60127.1 hypothetical protein SAMN05660830_00425 [Halodesulfovibrio aestuarii]